MSKRWLITGSARGIGRALAQAVLEAGHRLDYPESQLFD